MTSKELQVLSITDLHFNPFYDSSLIDQLVKSEFDKWDSIFSSSSIKTFSKYGEDTNYPLLESFFQQISSIEKIDFVMFSGDFLGHSLRELYEQNTSDTSMSGFESFITKTFKFLVQKFQKYLPGQTIYPAIGNDDNFDGDYKIAANGAFLKMVAENWKPILKLPATFNEGGYYSTSIPSLENNKLIVLNNIFMSTRYDVANKVDEGQVQIDWLKNEISNNKDKQIWLMFHEPLGVNIYPTIKKDDYSNPNDVEIFLKKNYYSQIINELKNAGSQIRIIFSGHTHMDSFRLLHNDNEKPIIYNHITPAVSPIFGNNPAFQVFTFDAETNLGTDYISVFLDLNKTNPSWQTEYIFSETYKQNTITPDSIYAIWKNLEQNKQEQSQYRKFYEVSTTPISDKNWKVYYESMSELTAKNFALEFQD